VAYPQVRLPLREVRDVLRHSSATGLVTMKRPAPVTARRPVG
jgi:hypothetical protein